MPRPTATVTVVVKESTSTTTATSAGTRDAPTGPHSQRTANVPWSCPGLVTGPSTVPSPVLPVPEGTSSTGPVDAGSAGLAGDRHDHDRARRVAHHLVGRGAGQQPAEA